jgi:hypothetical protein
MVRSSYQSIRPLPIAKENWGKLAGRPFARYKKRQKNRGRKIDPFYLLPPYFCVSRILE